MTCPHNLPRTLKLRQMFDVANWVAHLSGEDGPGGTSSQGTLSVSPQGAPSLVRDHFRSPRVVAKSTNMMKGTDLHPKTTRIQIFTDTSNEGWGAHSEQVFTKGLWSDRDKATHKCSGVESGFFGPQKSLRASAKTKIVLVATDKSTVVAYINKQGVTNLVGMCDTLGPAGLHIFKTLTLTGYFLAFMGSSQSSRNLPNGTSLLFLTSSLKHPLSL